FFSSRGRHTSWPRAWSQTCALPIYRLRHVAEVASLVLTAGQTATADFRLVPQAIELNPVVAVGYGEQRKATLTGSVSAVQGEQIDRKSVVEGKEGEGGRQAGGIDSR